LEADREDQQKLARRRKEAAKARREREDKLRKDREEVFGASSMFATQLDVAQPQASSDLDLEAFRGLLATQAQEIWREHVPGGHHALTGLRVPHLASYVPNAVQLLLRLPAVSMWLAKHAEHCEMGSTEEGRSERCVTCALWASRRNFNERAGRGERKSFVPLFVRRGLVGKVFASGGEQDVCAFFRTCWQRCAE